jgi:hypothetical protein
MNANRPTFLNCLLFLFLVLGLEAANAPACAQESGPNRGNEAPRQTVDAVTQGAAQNNPAEQSAIQVEKWSQPQPGWLYVLDPKPGDAAGRIWLLDPQTGKVMGSIRTSASPDFALSPDGSRLYVASSTGNDSNQLAVIDTAPGLILKSGAVVGRAAYDELPPFSTMAVSGDGLALRVLIDAPKSEDKDAFLLATFDTRAGEFLPGIVHLGNCGPGRFISYPAADHFDFLCPRTNRVRLIRVDADSREVQNHDVELPWERRVGVAEVFESPDSTAMAIVRGDGAVVGMSVATQQSLAACAKNLLRSLAHIEPGQRSNVCQTCSWRSSSFATLPPWLPGSAVRYKFPESAAQYFSQIFSDSRLSGCGHGFPPSDIQPKSGNWIQRHCPSWSARYVCRNTEEGLQPWWNAKKGRA